MRVIKRVYTTGQVRQFEQDLAFLNPGLDKLATLFQNHPQRYESSYLSYPYYNTQLLS